MENYGSIEVKIDEMLEKRNLSKNKPKLFTEQYLKR